MKNKTNNITNCIPKLAKYGLQVKLIVLKYKIA